MPSPVATTDDSSVKLPSLLHGLFLAVIANGRTGEPTAPALEPVYRWAIADESERFATREQLHLDKRNLTNTPPAFLAVPPGHCWPGLVPVFSVELAGRFELRRRSLRGQENFTDPIFFALPLEDETVAPKIAGRWEVTATRSSGADAWFQWELTAEGDKLSGRFDQNADYRVAHLAGGTFRSNQVELAIDYMQNKYALTAEWREGKMRGVWRETEDGEHGRWEAKRVPPTAPLPTGELFPLYEWRREGVRRYSVESPGPGWTKSPHPLCRVWKPVLNLPRN
jgi:hypothetical protein